MNIDCFKHCLSFLKVEDVARNLCICKHTYGLHNSFWNEIYYGRYRHNCVILEHEINYYRVCKIYDAVLKDINNLLYMFFGLSYTLLCEIMYDNDVIVSFRIENNKIYVNFHCIVSINKTTRHGAITTCKREYKQLFQFLRANYSRLSIQSHETKIFRYVHKNMYIDVFCHNINNNACYEDIIFSGDIGNIINVALRKDSQLIFKKCEHDIIDKISTLKTKIMKNIIEPY